MLQTPAGVVTFERNPVPVRLDSQMVTPTGTVVRIVPLEKPSIWADNTRIPMLVQILMFAFGSLLVAVVFIGTTPPSRPTKETQNTIAA